EDERRRILDAIAAHPATHVVVIEPDDAHVMFTPASRALAKLVRNATGAAASLGADRALGGRLGPLLTSSRLRVTRVHTLALSRANFGLDGFEQVYLPIVDGAYPVAADHAALMAGA